MPSDPEHAHADYKAPNGKLIRIDASLKDGKIENIIIHGDFFIYPEESITEIETILIGVRADDFLGAKRRLDALISGKKIKLVGLTVDDIIEALKKANGKNKDL